MFSGICAHDDFVVGADAHHRYYSHRYCYRRYYISVLLYPYQCRYQYGWGMPRAMYASLNRNMHVDIPVAVAITVIEIDLETGSRCVDGVTIAE